MENTGAGAVREPRLADFTLSSVFHWFVSQSAFTPHPVNRRKTGRIETVRDITDDIVDKLRGSLWFQMTRMCHRQLQPNFYCGDQDILLHFSGSCVTIVGKATKHAEVYHKKKRIMQFSTPQTGVLMYLKGIYFDPVHVSFILNHS